MWVPTSPRETEEENAERWRKFFALSDSAKDILASEETDKKIKEISKQYSLSVEQAAYLSRAVRLFYFEELPLERFAAYIQEHTGVEASVAAQIAQVLVRRVIRKEIVNANVRMPLTAALKQFPDIAIQRITQQDIIMPEHVPGTVENWLQNYRSVMGSRTHNAIDRGKYLFHNRNTKSLSPQERQRVAMILKSYDEKIPLVINTAQPAIIFPAPQDIPHREGISSSVAHTPAPTSERKAANSSRTSPDKLSTTATGATRTGNRGTIKSASPSTPMGYVRFSSPQVFARERSSDAKHNTTV